MDKIILAIFLAIIIFKIMYNNNNLENYSTIRDPGTYGRYGYYDYYKLWKELEPEYYDHSAFGGYENIKYLHSHRSSGKPYE